MNRTPPALLLAVGFVAGITVSFVAIACLARHLFQLR